MLVLFNFILFRFLFVTMTPGQVTMTIGKPLPVQNRLAEDARSTDLWDLDKAEWTIFCLGT